MNKNGKKYENKHKEVMFEI